MQTLITICTWLKAHFLEIVSLWTTIIGATEIIVKWTDTKKDDEILNTIRAWGIKIISWLTKFGFEEQKAK